MAGRPMATPKRFVRSGPDSHALATSPDPSRNPLAVGVEDLDSRADANPLLAFSSEPHGAIPDGPLEELTARVRRAAESNRDETKLSALRTPAGCHDQRAQMGHGRRHVRARRIDGLRVVEAPHNGGRPRCRAPDWHCHHQLTARRLAGHH